jgi:cytochrome P450
VVVRDPEQIWRVLVTDASSFRPGKWKRRARRFLGETLNTLDGDEHRSRRRLLQPSVDRRRIAAFTPAIVSRVDRAHARWAEGTRLQLRDELDRLALTVAGDVLLSTDLEPQAAQLAPALCEIMTGVPRFTPPILATRQARALVEVGHAVSFLIAERLRAPRNDDDLIGALLASGLPESTVRGEVIAFLLAAVDEPPSALEAAWYLLGRNPDAERRLHAELDAVLGDRVPTLDDEAQLPYLDAVLRETLRLFPPARHIDRCPVTDVRIAGSRVRKGSNVVVSPLVTHHDPRLYDRPSAFVPERWLEPTPPQRMRGAYLPFGAGAHSCIGEPLAHAIMMLTLATTSRRFCVRVDADAPPPGPRAPRLVVTLERR